MSKRVSVIRLLRQLGLLLLVFGGIFAIIAGYCMSVGYTFTGLGSLVMTGISLHFGIEFLSEYRQYYHVDDYTPQPSLSDEGYSIPVLDQDDRIVIYVEQLDAWFAKGLPGNQQGEAVEVVYWRFLSPTAILLFHKKREKDANS